MNNYYITTTLPYLNSDPHIGFALEIIKADAIARFKRLKGYDVFFNTGTDEHGAKIYEKAGELGLDTQKFCDQQVESWLWLKEVLNLSYDKFTRTTDPEHVKAAQRFWQICFDNDLIYKKFYKIKYCVGCELEKTDSELVNCRCPLHPNREIESIEEENYFFKFSHFQKMLLKFYEANTDFVIPEKRFNEIKKFVASGLEDFSISRLKSKMPWGIEVPGDKDHVMYVWFDALANYLSAIGWPEDKNLKKWWPAVQIAGKDNLRQQSAMLQAMLMAVGVEPSKKIYINSFITSGGQKMSKSLGNVIKPYEMVEKFGTDGTRYLLLAYNSFGEDIDITWQSMTEKYNADLANGLGNLTARVSNMLEKNEIKLDLQENSDETLICAIEAALEIFATDKAIEILWQVLRKNDEYLTQKQPWKMTDKEEIREVLQNAAQDILNVGVLLEPFMPETSKKIVEQFQETQIKKGGSLFPRI